MIVFPSSHPFVPSAYPYERRRLPSKFYRVDRENAFTIYRPIPEDPREESDLAFQTQGEFDLAQDLTKERVTRHLTWRDRAFPPTCYISVFDNYDKAQDRADFNFHRAPSNWQARRISIMKIDTSNLIRAEFYPRRAEAAIPIWVDETCFKKVSMFIPVKKVEMERTQIWISIAEVRRVFDIPRGTGQDDEWLACDHVFRSRIDCVMPYDGFKVYTTPGDKKIKVDGWEFDWKAQAWVTTKVQVGYADDEDEVKNDEKSKERLLPDIREQSPLEISPSTDLAQLEAVFGDLSIAT